MDNVKSWTFSINQTVVKFMGCMNHKAVTAMEPYILGFGSVTADMKIDTFLPDTAPIAGWNMSEIYSGSEIVSGRKALSIMINGNNFLDLTGELISATDPFQGAESVDNLTWDYPVYSYS